MDALPYVDSLVKEYMLFRGLAATLATFKREAGSDPACGFQADAICALVFGDLVPGLKHRELMDVFEVLDTRVFSRLDAAGEATSRRLEASVLKCLLVTAVQQGRRDVVQQFFAAYGDELVHQEQLDGCQAAAATAGAALRPQYGEPVQLSGGSGWRSWCALGVLQSPESDPLFAPYFAPEWQSLLQLSLRNFLDAAVSQLPLPALLRYNTDRLQRVQLQQLVEALQQEVQQLRAKLAAAGAAAAAAAPPAPAQPPPPLPPPQARQHQKPPLQPHLPPPPPSLSSAGPSVVQAVVPRASSQNGTSAPLAHTSNPPSRPADDKFIAAATTTGSRSKEALSAAPAAASSSQQQATATAAAAVPQAGAPSSPAHGAQSLAGRGGGGAASAAGSSRSSGPPAGGSASGRWRVGRSSVVECDAFQGSDVTCNRWAPDGRNIATAAANGAVCIWSPPGGGGDACEERNAVLRSSGAASAATALAWDSRSNKLLLVGSARGGVRAWHADTKRFVAELPPEPGCSCVLSLAASPSEPHFVCSAAPVAAPSGGTVHGYSTPAVGAAVGRLTLWHTRTFKRALTFVVPDSEAVCSTSYSPDGALLAAACAATGRLLVYDSSSAAALPTAVTAFVCGDDAGDGAGSGRGAAASRQIRLVDTGAEVGLYALCDHTLQYFSLRKPGAPVSSLSLLPPSGRAAGAAARFHSLAAAPGAAASALVAVVDGNSGSLLIADVLKGRWELVHGAEVAPPGSGSVAVAGSATGALDYRGLDGADLLPSLLDWQPCQAGTLVAAGAQQATMSVVKLAAV